MTREYWYDLLAKFPICTKCGINPHAINSQWCKPCINSRRKIAREADAGGWYKRLTPEQRQKRRARAVIHHSIKRGKMERKPCEVCGEPNGQAHHHNGYDKPHVKDVKFLCFKHHKEEEAKNNLLTVTTQ